MVTGASSGTGHELAKLCVENGFGLVIAADMPEIVESAQALTAMGARVEQLQVDLSTTDAMRRGEGDVIDGLKNKIHGALGAIAPESVKAQQHRKMAEPGSGQSGDQSNCSAPSRAACMISSAARRASRRTTARLPSPNRRSTEMVGRSSRARPKNTSPGSSSGAPGPA